jgi:hypothetical protein
VGFDVAQFAHVGRRCLTGVEDEANCVGVPYGIPVTWNGLPVRHAAQRCQSDQQGSQQHACCDHQCGSPGHRAGLGLDVANAAQRDPQTQRDTG